MNGVADISKVNYCTVQSSLEQTNSHADVLYLLDEYIQIYGNLEQGYNKDVYFTLPGNSADDISLVSDI